MTESSTILQWINAHPHLSGLITFIISAAESVAIIGTIVPGSIMMTAIGTLAGANIIPLWSTILWAILGAIVGDGISYWMGVYFKDRLHYIWPFRSHPYLLNNGEIFFRKYGSMSVFIGRFVGPVRALVPLVAGMLGMKPLRFAIANITSAIGWAPAYMLPGILLGAASLELPPDIAVQAMLMLLLMGLLLIVCIWSIQKLLSLIGKQIDQLLNWIWGVLFRSRYFHLVTTVLKHYDPRKTHGQLTLAFYLIITTVVFLSLTLQIYLSGSQDIAVNDILFHLFRSIRTPNTDSIAYGLTLLGQKDVLIPVMVILIGWFAITQHWRTAVHAAILMILTLGSVWVIKDVVHSPRPWGIAASLSERFSYPSGHASLATIFYFGLALLFIKSFNTTFKRRWLIFSLATVIVLSISISRLQLNAHWLTDIIGAWLLSAILLMVMTLSYNHKPEKTLKPLSIFIVTALSLLISFSINYHVQLQKMRAHYTAEEWPTYSLPMNAWWHQQGAHIPHLRLNRFGLHSEVFSLQWIGNLQQIKDLLLKNGWEEVPPRDWISILHRITGIESTQELPLVAAIHLDKQPVLVLMKQIAGEKKLIALRLWDSHVTIEHLGRLWVGSIESIPRTYSGLLRRDQNQVPISTALLFNSTPAALQFKTVTVMMHHKKQLITKNIILIKPSP